MLGNFNTRTLRLMKTHTRSCTNTKPCQLEHTYFCKYCGTEFTTDIDTHFRTPAGITIPNETWPYCGESCDFSDNQGANDAQLATSIGRYVSDRTDYDNPPEDEPNELC